MLDPLELPRGIGPQLHGLEGRLHDVRGPQMNPVFLGIVEEGDQPLSVSTEAGTGFGRIQLIPPHKRVASTLAGPLGPAAKRRNSIPS